jgi:hypothetical protein
VLCCQVQRSPNSQAPSGMQTLDLRATQHAVPSPFLSVIRRNLLLPASCPPPLSEPPSCESRISPPLRSFCVGSRRALLLAVSVAAAHAWSNRTRSNAGCIIRVFEGWGKPASTPAPCVGPPCGETRRSCRPPGERARAWDGAAGRGGLKGAGVWGGRREGALQRSKRIR